MLDLEGLERRRGGTFALPAAFFVFSPNFLGMVDGDSEIRRNRRSAVLIKSD
jgi:hypothetical protein